MRSNEYFMSNTADSVGSVGCWRSVYPRARPESPSSYVRFMMSVTVRSVFLFSLSPPPPPFVVVFLLRFSFYEKTACVMMLRGVTEPTRNSTLVCVQNLDRNCSFKLTECTRRPPYKVWSETCVNTCTVGSECCFWHPWACHPINWDDLRALWNLGISAVLVRVIPKW